MNNKIIINFYEYGKMIYVTVITVDFDGTLYKGNSFNAMFQLAQKEFTIKEWLVVGQGVVISAFAGLLKGRERSEEHTSELQSRGHLVCRLLLEKKKNK